MSRHRKQPSEAPESLSTEERRKLLVWLLQEIEARRLPREFGEIKRRRLMLDECLDWHRSNGVLRCDWAATARNWFRKAVTMERERAQSRRELYRYEHPQEPRDGLKDGELTLIYGGKR